MKTHKIRRDNGTMVTCWCGLYGTAHTIETTHIDDNVTCELCIDAMLREAKKNANKD